ncbi:hypothetical protein DKM44_12970 [Deinococcus irradiatisoli]|uniref:Uncharacterized protein n=1 Tax=Deinococcus irradiatisoli TaxID=2202254 RepID=A0A2Z3JFT2_9DEIO|nr:hypothetical protein [Deinococcus irradiatisoli]AWN24033.1 hypothetical protein DKM44_12970 [Deinococcus irradiatisoli]
MKPDGDVLASITIIGAKNDNCIRLAPVASYLTPSEARELARGLIEAASAAEQETREASVRG